MPDFGPTVITLARIEIAALLGVATLLVTQRLRAPERRYLPGMLVTGIGLAVGFPFFIALAVQRVPASHGAVVVGLVPAATAVMSVIRTRERPSAVFWLGSVVGMLAVTAFAIGRGEGRLQLADVWLAAAVLSVAIGYVEGGRLARDLGGTTLLCWTMMLLAPLAAIPLAIAVAAHEWQDVSWQAWSGFLYAGVVSMFLGSVMWYRGLATGGIARIGQLNLVQPLLALVWSALLLREHLSWAVLLTAIVVVLSVATCINSRPSID